MNCALLFEKHLLLYALYVCQMEQDAWPGGEGAAQVDSRLAIAVKQ